MLKAAFEQGFNDENAEQSKGFGLGLSIIQNLCNKYGFEFNAKNHKDKGCTFLIFIPKTNVYSLCAEKVSGERL